MKKLNQEQIDWLTMNFTVFRMKFHVEFGDPIDLLKTLVGEYHFRGEEYNGKSTDFTEDVYLLITGYTEGEEFIALLLKNLEGILKKAELETDYYELCSNLKTMIDSIYMAFYYVICNDYAF